MKRSNEDSKISTKRQKTLLIDYLKLISQPSIFHGKVFYEKINLPVFRKLMASKHLGSGKQDIRKTKTVNEVFLFSKINNRLNDGMLPVKYTINKSGFGRVTAAKGISLGCMRRLLRGTLCHGMYVDLDMENAYPSILHCLCKHHEIPCPMLSKYVSGREEWLKRLETHTQEGEPTTFKQGKKLLHRIIHGGTYKSWMKGDYVNGRYIHPRQGEPDEWTVNFELEMKDIREYLMSKNPELIDSVKKVKDHNVAGSFIAIYLGEFERRLLESTYECLRAKGLTNYDSILMNDGLMVPAGVPDDICDQLGDHLLRTTGFDITFTRKAFEMIDDLDEETIVAPQPIPPEVVEHPMEDFQAKMNITGNFEHYAGNLFYATGPWSCPLKEHHQSRLLNVYSSTVYCYGCRETFGILSSRSDDEVKELVFEHCGHFHLLQRFFEYDGDRLGAVKKSKLLEEIEIKSSGQYQLQRDGAKLKVDMEYMEIAGRFIKTPHKLRDALFSERYTPLDEALNRVQVSHENTIDKPIIEDGIECGRHMPAFQFGDSLRVEPMERERCGYRAIVDTNTVAASNGMGSGKTHSVIDLIDDKLVGDIIINGPAENYTDYYGRPVYTDDEFPIYIPKYESKYEKILVIVGRCSFGDQVLKNLNAKGGPTFVKYDDYLNRDGPRVVCQVDSLEKVALTRDGVLREWDLIILDEAMTTLEHFAAKTFTRARAVFDLLVTICKRAPKLIVMDADMEKSDHVDWFLNTCERRYTKIRSTVKWDDRHYLRVSSQDNFYDRISELIRKGLKVVIMSNTKAEIKKWHARLEEDFPDKKGLAIYNEKDHTYKNLLINGEIRAFDPDRDTKDLNWFAYSPSIAPGISIKDPFDVLCAHASCSEYTAGVRYWNQMLFRVRKLTKKLVLYQVQGACPQLPTDIDDIKMSYENGKAFLCGVDLDIDYSTGRALLKKDPFTQNTVYIEQQTRYSGFFEETFKKWKTQEGGTFGYLELNKVPVDKTVKRDILFEIANAPVLTKEEFLRRKDQPLAEVKKYFHMKRYNIREDCTPEELLPHLRETFNNKTIDRFSRLYFEKQTNDMVEEERRKIMTQLIRIGGWRSILDPEELSDPIDEIELEKLFTFVQSDKRLAKEMRVTGKPLAEFAIKAFNWMGKLLGLGQIMTGKNGYRKRKLLTNKFASQVELILMRKRFTKVNVKGHGLHLTRAIYLHKLKSNKWEHLYDDNLFDLHQAEFIDGKVIIAD